MAQPRPMRERRTPLTRERVLDAAMRLADEQGIGALTMRRLAQNLGVEAMTIYYHVANKDEILSELTEAVVAEFELPSPDGDWKAGIRTTAMSAYRVLLRHPWAAGLTLSLRSPTPSRLRYMDAILGSLASAGFSEELADRAYHAIEGHIMGFTLWEVGMNLGTHEDFAALASEFLRRLPRREFPHVAEHVEHHMQERAPGDPGTYEFGLDLILDGLERQRDKTSESARALSPERLSQPARSRTGGPRSAR